MRHENVMADEVEQYIKGSLKEVAEKLNSYRNEASKKLTCSYIFDNDVRDVEQYTKLTVKIDGAIRLLDAVVDMVLM